MENRQGGLPVRATHRLGQEHHVLVGEEVEVGVELVLVAEDQRPQAPPPHAVRGDEESQRRAWEDLGESCLPHAHGPDFDALIELFEASTPPEQRSTSQANTRLCRSVRDFLDWLGSGRPVTPSGWLRRADIEPVAAMVGIHAVGSARACLPDPDGATGFPTSSSRDAVPVRSMGDVPLLSTWWWTLQTMGIVTVQGSRVRPGPAAPLWLGGDIPPLEETTALISRFVELAVFSAPTTGPMVLGHSVALHAVLRLAGVLRADLEEPGSTIPDPLEEHATDAEEGFLLAAITERTRSRYRDLITAGVLEGSPQLPRVPRGLGAALAHGAARAFDDLDEIEEDTTE